MKRHSAKIHVVPRLFPNEGNLSSIRFEIIVNDEDLPAWVSALESVGIDD